MTQRNLAPVERRRSHIDHGRLRFAIAGCALLMVAALLIAAVLLARHDLDRSLSALDQENRRHARTLAEHVARAIEYADRIVLDVKARYEQTARGFELERYAREGRINRALIAGIVITDAAGEAKQTDASGARPANPMDREQFSVHADPDNVQPFVSRSPPSRARARGGIVVSRRLVRRDGIFDGIVGVVIDADSITDFFRDLGPGDKSIIALTDLDDYLRARTDGGASFPGQQMNRDRSTVDEGGSESGIERYFAVVDAARGRIAYRRLDNHPLVAVIAASGETALAAAHARVRTYYTGAAIASVLVVFAAFALLMALRRSTSWAREETGEARAADPAESVRDSSAPEDSTRNGVEAARDESDARLRLAFEAAGITNWEWDIGSDQTRWGHQHERLLGPLPPGTARYPEFREMVHAEDRARFLAAGRATRERGDPYDIEFRLMRTDGRMCWLRSIGRAVRDENGKIIRMVGIIQDVTDRRDIERALAESHRRRDALLEGIPAPAWLRDCDGRFIAVNKAWLARHNVSQNEIVGKTDADFFSADQVKLIREEDGRVIRTRAPVKSERRRFSKNDEWIEIVKVPLLDDAGNVVAVVGISHDITEHRRSEQTIRAMNEALAQKTAQLTALNTELEAFSYSVSHDLRAPLRSILGFGSFLVTNNMSQLDVEGQGRLRRILAAAERMGQLIDDLLKLARISRQTLAVRRVDLHALAAEVFAELRDSSPQRRVEVVIATDLIVEADSGLMRVVLDNLIGNAWKFTVSSAAPRIEFGCAIIDGIRTFFVRDNGAGFDMAYAGRLFTPFQRLHTQQQFEGTGIGLATVKRIVERHHGRVWVESAVEKGTSVYFTLGAAGASGVAMPA